MRLSRNDRKAIIIIAALLLAVNVGLYFFHGGGSNEQQDPPTPLKRGDSIVENPSPPFKGDGGLSHFDPNTADSATLVGLGLRPNVARAIIHYRQAGGVFRRPSDLARIYTLSDSDFRRIEKYIRIAKQPSQIPPAPLKGGDRPALNTAPPFKGAGGIPPINLNTADTAELMAIPCVGPYYAGKIIKYRNRLGGFISVEQLAEIKGLPEDIARHTTVGHEPIAKLRINELTFGQLLRHPYLNFEQVRAVMDHRQHYGPIADFSDLKTYAAFSEADFERLTPYVDFR